ncbi:hypothetical protein GBAR_LOCUS21193 [Geodia barretti]|uniref:Uncharacterized protein n=1 Tax=Geodia barretti TaxID=519541 RepID=A0AA35X4P5_GEOBA|nr:hypothetical protein GBAR_LOCUS21193 [Geodia barretti]
MQLYIEHSSKTTISFSHTDHFLNPYILQVLRGTSLPAGWWPPGRRGRR